MKPTLPDVVLDHRTQARQRDELITIIDNESSRPSSRRRLVVPLLAAAAVVAVIAGLAFAVPALRGTKAQPQVAGPDTASAKPELEPLTAAEKEAYAKKCDPSGGKPARKGTVVDGFKWVDPPADSRAIAWVLVKGMKMTNACGFNTKGQVSEIGFASSGETMQAVIHKTGAGSGSYARSVARITIAIGTGPATEAVLRNGFFFAPMKYVDTYNPKTPDAPPTYTVRAYDAAGKLIYASAKTQREMTAQFDGCYTDPAGTRVVYVGGGRKGTPPVSQCSRGVAWNW